MSKRNRRSVATEKVEDKESKSLAVLSVTCLISIVIFISLILIYYGRLSINVYNTSGSILNATMTFIGGIVLVLLWLILFAIIGEFYDIINYLIFISVGFLVIMFILFLISLF